MGDCGLPLLFPSDFHAMKAFFNLMKIEYEADERGGTTNYIDVFTFKNSIRLKEGCGHRGKTCEFYFDEKGKFIKHGVWE